MFPPSDVNFLLRYYFHLLQTSIKCLRWLTIKDSQMYINIKVKVLRHVQLFGTPWTVACQAPLSMGFSRQECWSGLSFPSPEDFPDPGIEPGSLPHCRQILYHLNHTVVTMLYIKSPEDIHLITRGF